MRGTISVALGLLLGLLSTVGCKKDSTSEPANPAPPGEYPTGRVIYTDRAGSGPLGIHIIDGNATNDITLASPGGNPKFSPNGQRIAYTVGTELWVMNSDGSSKARLLPRCSYSRIGNIWSPTSDKIVVGIDSAGYPYTVNVVNIDGTGSTAIARGSSPQWSPTGNRISYESDSAGSYNGIWVANPDGSSPHKVTSVRPNFAYVWSPTGDKLAIINPSQDITVVTVSTTASITIPGPSGFSAYEPNWSEDGTIIVFSATRQFPIQSQIFTMNPDGSSLTRITNDTLEYWDPKFSPDGNWIVFHKFPSGATHVMKRDGSNIIRLTDGEDDVDGDWKP